MMFFSVFVATTAPYIKHGVGVSIDVAKRMARYIFQKAEEKVKQKASEKATEIGKKKAAEIAERTGVDKYLEKVGIVLEEEKEEIKEEFGLDEEKFTALVTTISTKNEEMRSLLVDISLALDKIVEKQDVQLRQQELQQELMMHLKHSNQTLLSEVINLLIELLMNTKKYYDSLNTKLLEDVEEEMRRVAGKIDRIEEKVDRGVETTAEVKDMLDDINQRDKRMEETFTKIMERLSGTSEKYKEDTFGGQLVLAIIGTSEGQPLFVYEGSRRIKDGDPGLVISLLSSLLYMHLGAIGESNVDDAKITISNTGYERYFWVVNYSKERHVFVAMLFSTEMGVFDSFFSELSERILAHESILEMAEVASTGEYPKIPEDLRTLIEEELNKKIQERHLLHLSALEVINGALKVGDHFRLTLRTEFKEHTDHEIHLKRVEIFLPATSYVYFSDTPHGYVKVDSGIMELSEPFALPMTSELEFKFSTKDVDDVPRLVTINVRYSCETCGWTSVRPLNFFVYRRENPIFDVKLTKGPAVTYSNGHADLIVKITLQTYTSVNRKNLRAQWVNLIGLNFPDPDLKLVSLLKNNAETHFIFPGRYVLTAKFAHDTPNSGAPNTTYRGSIMFSLTNPRRVDVKDDVDIFFSTIPLAHMSS